jgi:hypothetical protein
MSWKESKDPRLKQDSKPSPTFCVLVSGASRLLNNVSAGGRSERFAWLCGCGHSPDGGSGSPRHCQASEGLAMPPAAATTRITDLRTGQWHVLG